MVKRRLLGDQKEATRIGNEIAKRVYPRRRFLGGLPAINDTQGHATVLGAFDKALQVDSKKMLPSCCLDREGQGRG